MKVFVIDIKSPQHLRRVEDCLFTIGHYWWDRGSYYCDDVPKYISIHCDKWLEAKMKLDNTDYFKAKNKITLQDLERQIAERELEYIFGSYLHESKRRKSH